MRVALVAPPRHYWAFVNDYDHFMLPQALPTLAAAVREAGHEVLVVDCLPQRIGWQSLVRLLTDFKPQVLAAGENHAVFSHEIVRLARVAKQVDPDCWTVIGGTHFAFLDRDYLGGELDAPAIDLIARGEGERTLVELLEELARHDPRPERVPGISRRLEGGGVVRAPNRPLIADLDTLPRPAYDLLPMRRYGRSKFGLAAHGATIHKSRGCPTACDFCAFWINMADERPDGNGGTKLVARWRTKSVEKTLDEIEYLYREFDRRYFVFVDDTFNVDPRWSDAFAEALIKRKLRIKYYAFLRADLVVRDEKLGVMEKLVRAGLVHASIGVERQQDAELSAFNKKVNTRDVVPQCMDLLKRKYPEVFRQATFLVGIQSDTRESIAALGAYAKLLAPDYAGFHPLTPIPGTPLWTQQNGAVSKVDFTEYDWMTPILPTDHLSRDEIDEATFDCTRQFVSIGWLLRGLFGRGDYSRRLYMWWVAVMIKMMIGDLLRLKNPLRCDAFKGLQEPAWYRR